MGFTTNLVVDVDVTVSVTGTVTEPAREETSTEAGYVPAAKLPGLMETPIELGVVPLVRLTDNQGAPEVESVKAIVLLLVTDRVWGEGTVPPR
ncbi:MAG TPA: hypothetical protein VEK84_18360 [Terriglobales bacterium]|nr:hypothetical protein [Terriglobales bacterium]